MPIPCLCLHMPSSLLLPYAVSCFYMLFGTVIPTSLTCFYSCIIELVDCICRDGADMPISLNKRNGSELLNADVFSFLDKQHTLRVLLYTIILSKYVKYKATVILSKLEKTPILLLSSSVQMGYCETGVSNHSNSYMKIIYTGVYMILDAQNLHTFSQCRKTPGLQPYKC